MSPSKLRAWLNDQPEPMTLRDIVLKRQGEAGFVSSSERRIQHSLKALEAAGLVTFNPGEHGSKLWYVIGSKADKTGGIDADYANSAE